MTPYFIQQPIHQVAPKVVGRRLTPNRPLTPQDIRTHRKLKTYIPQKQIHNI